MTKTIEVERTILFGDCDPEGIVFTPRFSYFAIEAIQEALSIQFKKNSIQAIKDLNILPPVRAFNLEFLHPISWGEKLIQYVSVEKISEHSFTCGVTGYNSKKIKIYSANLTHVIVSDKSKEVIPIPESLRKMLQSS